MTYHQSQVFINEGIFGILDHGEVPIESVDWSGGLIAPMSSGPWCEPVSTPATFTWRCTRVPRRTQEENGRRKPKRESGRLQAAYASNRLSTGRG
jgi:hypothetical protein